MRGAGCVTWRRGFVLLYLPGIRSGTVCIGRKVHERVANRSLLLHHLLLFQPIFTPSSLSRRRTSTTPQPRKESSSFPTVNRPRATHEKSRIQHNSANDLPPRCPRRRPHHRAEAYSTGSDIQVDDAITSSPPPRPALLL